MDGRKDIVGRKKCTIKLLSLDSSDDDMKRWILQLNTYVERFYHFSKDLELLLVLVLVNIQVQFSQVIHQLLESSYLDMDINGRLFEEYQKWPEYKYQQ